MNAPEQPSLPILAKVASIFPSPTNPRKRFPNQAHEEMVASVKEHGVLQPILLRPWPKNGTLPKGKCIQYLLDTADQHGAAYELVAGERRWRAAVDAPLDDILAVVRDLTDIQVLEIQVIENLQREDVHPIEEAEGYGRLMKEAGYNADTLGEKVAKSRAYIYARLKLLDLCDEARDAFYEGRLDASTALLVARIPGKVLQKRAVKEITTGYNGAMSYRAAKEHVRRNFMLRLADAAFKPGDTKLIPEAGSCAACPKRTGNNPDLFGDVDDADVCTDPECFENKRLENYLQLKEKAEKKGIKVIDGDEAKKLMPYGEVYPIGGNYVSLDARCHEDDNRRTYREILGKAAPIAAAIQNTSTYGKSRPLVEVAEKKALAEALKKAGFEARQKNDPEQQKREAERAERETAHQVEQEWRERLFASVRERFGKRFAETKTLAPEELTLLAVNFFLVFEQNAGYEDMERLTMLWGNPVIDDNYDEGVQKFADFLITIDASALCLFLTDLAFIGEVDAPRWSTDKPERLIAEAKRQGIDPDALRKVIEKERKAKEKPQPDAKKTAKTAPPPTPAAQAQKKGATKAAPANDLERACA